jgi:hypothetical protein
MDDRRAGQISRGLLTRVYEESRERQLVDRLLALDQQRVVSSVS